MNIDHLKEKFDLNELEVSLLEYIKKNQKQLKNITIRQMAKDNFTSTSAIYRLCNKLEFTKIPSPASLTISFPSIKKRILSEIQ